MLSRLLVTFDALLFNTLVSRTLHLMAITYKAPSCFVFKQGQWIVSTFWKIVFDVCFCFVLFFSFFLFFFFRFGLRRGLHRMIVKIVFDVCVCMFCMYIYIFPLSNLAWESVYIEEEFWSMYWLNAESDGPEVTLCDW